MTGCKQTLALPHLIPGSYLHVMDMESPQYHRHLSNNEYKPVKCLFIRFKLCFFIGNPHVLSLYLLLDNRNLYIEITSRFLLRQGYQGWTQIRSDWPTIKQIRGFLKISFSTFWLGEKNVLRLISKSPRFDPFVGNLTKFGTLTSLSEMSLSMK